MARTKRILAPSQDRKPYKRGSVECTRPRKYQDYTEDDRRTALLMVRSGQSFAQVAAQVGCSEFTLRNWWRNMTGGNLSSPLPPDCLYVSNHQELHTTVSSKLDLILNGITPEKIGEASLSELTNGAKIMHGLRRELEGAADANTQAIADAIASNPQAQAEWLAAAIKRAQEAKARLEAQGDVIEGEMADGHEDDEL